MLRSCRYCGRIHPSDYTCPKKPNRTKDFTKQNKFRSTNAWTQKSREIKERDNHLCQVCFRKLYDTVVQYNFEDIEVHHIEPLHESYDLRLEDENLLSLCARHHRMADAGQIPKAAFKAITLEQQKKVE